MPFVEPPTSMNILYVEDAEDQAAVVMTFLQFAEDPIEATHVGTLRETLKELKSNSFDCVLLDLGLPDGSGVHLVEEVKKVAPRTPVVVLTAKEESGLGVTCIEAGAQEFLSKLNLNPQRLAECLTYAVARNKEMAPALTRVLSRFKELHQGELGKLNPEHVESYKKLLTEPANLFSVEHWDLGRALAKDGTSSEQLLALHESCLKSLCSEVDHKEATKYLEKSDMMALATIAFMSDAYRDISLKATAKALSAKVRRRKA